MLRMTVQTQLVLRVLLDEPTGERYGLELSELTGLPTGTVYPILARLERVGWVDSSWEDAAVHESAGRPRRRFYRLTTDGAAQAADAIANATRPRRTPGWGIGPTGATSGATS